MGVSSLPWGNHGEWNGSQLRLPKRADGRKVEAKKNLQASSKITPQRQSDGFIARRTIVEWGWRGLVSGDKVRGALGTRIKSLFLGSGPERTRESGH